MLIAAKRWPNLMGNSMPDPFDLQRFVDPQRAEFESARSELQGGMKVGHWIWFIFPQIKGLGQSWMSQRYAISSLAEAQAYLQHPILGPRLRECTQLVNLVKGRSIEEIFGDIDAMKFRSSMTLFAKATDDNQVFLNALQKYFSGEFDPLTIQRL
jgi:uncharacterized protein (DUF1810 family)